MNRFMGHNPRLFRLQINNYSFITSSVTSYCMFPVKWEFLNYTKRVQRVVPPHYSSRLLPAGFIYTQEIHFFLISSAHFTMATNLNTLFESLHSTEEEQKTMIDTTETTLVSLVCHGSQARDRDT
ncbi:hypothetical protein V6N12_010537 [Hibiscus sabdariffa]|uniref:Uncharacterized protein n=1 Tax=Hibiscus sabdariffa TaxID=183260 RepID=A0ABR2EM25_9ROSI